MSNYQDLLTAAVARRLFNLSRSIETVIRTGRHVLEPELLEELWRYSRGLRERALELRPQSPPKIPDFFDR